MVSPDGPRDLATRVLILGRGAPWLCARCLRDGAELARRPLSSCPARDTQKPPLYVVARLIPIHGLGSLQRPLACTSLAQHRPSRAGPSRASAISLATAGKCALPSLTFTLPLYYLWVSTSPFTPALRKLYTSFTFGSTVASFRFRYLILTSDSPVVPFRLRYITLLLLCLLPFSISGHYLTLPLAVRLSLSISTI